MDNAHVESSRGTQNKGSTLGEFYLWELSQVLT